MWADSNWLTIAHSPPYSGRWVWNRARYFHQVTTKVIEFLLQSFIRYTVYVALASVYLYSNFLKVFISEILYRKWAVYVASQFIYKAIRRNVDLTRRTMFNHYFLSFLHNNEGFLLKRGMRSTFDGPDKPVDLHWMVRRWCFLRSHPTIILKLSLFNLTFLLGGRKEINTLDQPASMLQTVVWFLGDIVYQQTNNFKLRKAEIIICFVLKTKS